MSNQLIIGLDGGGTKTTCVLFDHKGFTIDIASDKGTNIYVFKDEAIARILSIVRSILEKNKLNHSDITAFGFGLAGISDLDSREKLLKELDRINITKHSLILSDVEAAYKVLCPNNTGILVNIGTGIVCFARDEAGNIIKEAGNGYDQGDLGSGYWLGKEIFSRLILNEGIVLEDSELNQIFEIVKSKFDVQSFRELYKCIEDDINIFPYLASLGEDTIDLAESGNDIALSIVQEGTRYVSEYIKSISGRMQIINSDIMLSINGSVIKNNFYRNLLEESLQYDFNKIHWISSVLSPAYGAGIMAGNYRNININLSNIIKGVSN
ncbi:MAG: hypothetical protein CMG66_00530 [Candidatus Marinimicrobia bacterium]|nr:hypothetical protein [Candidatus Neomarinimicrobiota bacterium]|tara:strand:- start:14278 stop:15249 length:972 start_codon:yes stop_codon:yes gene_type:complete